MSTLRTTHPIRRRQRGAVFIVMLVFMIMGVTAFLVSSLNSSAIQIARDQVTADALAQAKEALIGYAASADLTNPAAASPRPGNLPCPDNNPPGPLEGTPSACGGGYALGRLPWKTLGLPDLRDSSGERLWYAVSSNFKKAPPYTCCLNSDTPGTITVRSADGNIIYDAGLNNGVAAVIIAPGDVLQRTDQATLQDRSSAGYNIAKNYLDIAPSDDNSIFTDGSSTDGFIQGRIKDNSGNVIVNDQLLVVTQDNIMQAAQKRVAGEVKQCLNDYAANGVGLYPWATPTNDLNYFDNSGTLFGRIPNTPFNGTQGDNGVMQVQWGAPPNCNILSNSGWWLNWKEVVFYGLSDAFSPDHNVVAPKLTVNPPSTIADKKFVVIVAGKTLTGLLQDRSNPANKKTLSNYLESPNPTANPPPYPTVFSQSAPSATFNDTVVFQQ